VDVAKGKDARGKQSCSASPQFLEKFNLQKVEMVLQSPPPHGIGMIAEVQVQWGK